VTSLLFRHVEDLQGEAPWGRFLDAGVGVNSAVWSTRLATDAWTGVTAAEGHAAQVRQREDARIRTDDRLIVGNWTDDRLLAGEVFDTVLADYLLGAVEGFAPYFQDRLFARLRPHVGRRLYVVGLDPYVVGEAADPVGRMVRRIGRIRDICLTLADETPYREFPAEWVLDRLEGDGFRVLSARRFGNRYREAWISGQLDMALRRLPKIADGRLREAMAGEIEAIRCEAVELCRAHNGLRHGFDYVIACELA
jgi:hypothetical protein